MTRHRTAPLVVAATLGLLLNACATPAAKPPGGDARPATESAGKAAQLTALAIDGQHPERIKLSWQTEIGGRGVAVGVERQSGRVAAAAEGGPVKLYDFRSGKSAGVSASCTQVLRGSLYLVLGKLVVVCANKLEIYQLRGMKELPAPTLAESRATASTLAWPWLAVGHHDGVLRIYNLLDQSVREIAVPGPPIDVKSLALTKDGTTLAVAWIQGSIWWWKLPQPGENAAEPQRLERYENESDTLAFDPSGKWLAEEGEKGHTGIWAFDGTPSKRYQRKNGAWVKRMWFSQDGSWLLRGGSHGVDLVEVAGVGSTSLSSGLVEDLALDSDFTSLAAVDRDGRLSLWRSSP